MLMAAAPAYISNASSFKMEYGAPLRPLTLYKCALCDAQKPTHKRNNVEQHIWKHHGDQHGFDSRLYKYRVQDHKAYVAPFILTTTMEAFDPYMQKHQGEYGGGENGYPGSIPAEAGMSPMGVLGARREFSAPGSKGSTAMLYTCSLCKVFRPTNKRNNVEQHVWSHHPKAVGFDTARLKYRAGEHKASVTPFVVAIEVQEPPMVVAPQHSMTQQQTFQHSQHAAPPTVSVTQYDARGMGVAAVASNGHEPIWTSAPGSLEARAHRSLVETTQTPHPPQVMRPYSMPGRFAAGPYASNPGPAGPLHTPPGYDPVLNRPHSSLATYAAQPVASLPHHADHYGSGRSTPHALTPPMAGGPMRPVLNASLSNPGYEVKSRYSPTMEGNNGDQNQAQAQAQGHHARWRPY